MQNNQQKQLFTVLTPEQAATVEGGTVWVSSKKPISFSYWDKATKGWAQASSSPEAPWTYGGPGETTTIYYNYASGNGQDTYTTKDLAADSYYVFGDGINNKDWHDLYTSDPTYTKGKLWGVPAGTAYPSSNTY